MHGFFGSAFGLRPSSSMAPMARKRRIAAWLQISRKSESRFEQIVSKKQQRHHSAAASASPEKFGVGTSSLQKHGSFRALGARPREDIQARHP